MKITIPFFCLKSGSSIKAPQGTGNYSLVNKSWGAATEMTTHDITSILHTALEFRSAAHKPIDVRVKVPNLHCKSVTLLLKKSNEMLQAPFYSAGRFLSMPVRATVLPTWDEHVHCIDIRKIYELHTDCLFCETQFLSKSHTLIHGSPIPVVFIRTRAYKIVAGLAQLMTIFLRFGYLNGLNVIWIGPPCSTLNTLMAFCSKLSINFNYCCGFDTYAPASPSTLDTVIQQCSIDSKLFECKECGIENIKAFAQVADVIITSKQKNQALNITKDVLDGSKSGNIILHCLHRGISDIDDAIFEQDNCLVWEMVANMKWIFASLMVRVITEYEHVTAQPKFNR